MIALTKQKKNVFQTEYKVKTKEFAFPLLIIIDVNNWK